MSNQSRRDFIKSSILAGTAILTPASLMNLIAQGHTASTERIRVGVVGTGSRGFYLMQLIGSAAETMGIDIVAICDSYGVNLNMGQQLVPGAKAYTDYRKLLEHKGLEAIIVATPLHQHAHITIDALGNGIHVLCEKAMARTLEDTHAMYMAQRRTEKVLYVGHQRLFDPKFLEGIRMVHEGVLGDVTQIRAYWHRNNDWRRPVPPNQPELERQINWRLYREYSCGLLTELASHQVQVACWAKRDMPIDVRGTGSISFWKDGREVHDNVALIFRYADGTQFIYHSMIQNARYGFEEQVLGHKGTLELESNRFFTEDLSSIPKPAGIIQLVTDLQNNVFGTIPIGNPSWQPELASAYKGTPVVSNNNTDGTLEMLIAFANSVRTGKPVPGFLEQCYYGTVWSLLGQEAIDSGNVVRLPDEFKV